MTKIVFESLSLEGNGVREAGCSHPWLSHHPPGQAEPFQVIRWMEAWGHS